MLDDVEPDGLDDAEGVRVQIGCALLMAMLVVAMALVIFWPVVVEVLE